VHTVLAAEPAQVVGQPAVLAGAVAVGEPWHVMGVQDPVAVDQVPVLLHVLLMLPV
jgi:hypothetical protein